jgi:hypothetical protein
MWQQNENVIAESVTLRSNDIRMLIMEQSPSFGGMEQSPSSGGMEQSPASGGMEQSPSFGGMEQSPAIDGLARSNCERADAPRAMNLF